MNKKYLMLSKLRVVLILAFWVTIFINPVNISGQEKRETQEIRERLIRIEERMVTKEELKAEIKDVRNEIKEFMLWGFGITFAGIFALIGFVLWDRRTALAPAIRKSRELEEREERIERALKEMAQKDSNVAEALKHAGLL